MLDISIRMCSISTKSSVAISDAGGVLYLVTGATSILLILVDIVGKAMDFLVVLEGIATVVLATMSGSKAITSAQLASMPLKRVSITVVCTFITKRAFIQLMKCVLPHMDSFLFYHSIDHINMELLTRKFMPINKKTFQCFVSIKIGLWC